MDLGTWVGPAVGNTGGASHRGCWAAWGGGPCASARTPRSPHAAPALAASAGGGWMSMGDSTRAPATIIATALEMALFLQASQGTGERGHRCTTIFEFFRLHSTP